MPKDKKSEIRINYIHNQAVIIAPSRSRRPHNFESTVPKVVNKKGCPFCPESIDSQKALVTVGRKPWQIKVLPNKFPIVSTDNPAVYGRQEVIIETPKHNVELAELDVEQLTTILSIFAQRVRILEKDRRINYVLIFKNNGGKAGASIDHAHSQIFASEFLPTHVLNKLKRAEEYEIRRGVCYYCNLIKTEMNGPRWISKDNLTAAFTPYASSYNYEAWIFPRRHVDNITGLTRTELHSMAQTLKRILERLNSVNIPYNFYLHQVVHYKYEHLYLRICPRRDSWAGLELGSRLIVNTVSPEDAAKFYRTLPKKRKK
jgi:UDPglucose--hexose-1-phosphate uridylyltransferase